MKAVIFMLVFYMVVVGSLISYPFLLYPLPMEEQLVNQILADAAQDTFHMRQESMCLAQEPESIQSH